MSMIKNLRQRGALFVEFALILPLFLLVCLSLFYGGMYIHDMYAINELARFGVRFAAVEESNKTTEYDDPDNAGKFELSKKYVNVKKELADRIEKTPVILFKVHNIGSSGSDLTLDEDTQTAPGKTLQNLVIVINATRRGDAQMPPIVGDLIPNSISTTLTMRLEPEG